MNDTDRFIFAIEKQIIATVRNCYPQNGGMICMVGYYDETGQGHVLTWKEKVDSEELDFLSEKCVEALKGNPGYL